MAELVHGEQKASYEALRTSSDQLEAAKLQSDRELEEAKLALVKSKLELSDAKAAAVERDEALLCTVLVQHAIWCHV